MTIEKNYGAENDQQVPDGKLSKPNEEKQDIPDFESLLTDLAAVGEIESDSTGNTTNSDALSLDPTQEIMDLTYNDRSFYDDYGMAHVKQEPCLDSKPCELAMLKNAAVPPIHSSSLKQEPTAYHGDLALISEETAYYHYPHGRMSSHMETGTLNSQNIPSELGFPPEESFVTEYHDSNDMIQKIDRASVELGISKNPYQWECEHSHRWAEWTVRLYNLPVSYVMDFYMDGTSMCMLTLDDFRKRCPEFGDYLHAELEVWKSAYSYISSPLHSSGSSTSSDEETDLKYLNLDDDSTNVSSQSYTGISVPPNSLTLTSSASTVPSTLTSIPTPVIMSTTNQMGGSALPGQPSTPAYSMYRLSQSEPTLLQAAQGHRMGVGSASLARGIQSCVSPAPSSESLGSSGYGSWSASPEDKVEDMSSLLADSTCEPVHIGRGKHAIHLWQFLKELLLQPHTYHNCIRWLDRNKGIFKIEDSSRVAKLWGQRKNRPAMNYDKLSRSIRQYYKKGIIKKTENSKRLVYQFQPQYR